MLNIDVKRKINTLRDILVGKVPDPKAQVEQITVALIYKFMDDMDLQGVELGRERVFFTDGYKKYAFSQIMLAEHSEQERLNLYAEGMDKMSTNPNLPQLFREILHDTYIPYRDPATLNRFLKEIAEFSYEDSEELGNAFEYLLSLMGSQGDAGQFRTPRHIIDMMVEIIAPQKNEKILDPACGTAGFLVGAYNYIKKNNLDANGNTTLSADDKNTMIENFSGYDISIDMVRLSRVNMYLHGFAASNISEYDTLSNLEKWDDDYDVIFANPPFMTPKGGITPHTRYYVQSKRAEVLFVDYIAEHLNPRGRAAIIVPEGIVFQSQNAYKNLRRFLVDDGYLYGVISLPAGVFNPYSGVKTSVLLIDRVLAKEKDSVLFVRLNNDGFDLGAQRREMKGSEIPAVIHTFRDYQSGIDVADQENVVLVKKAIISEQDYILVGERYSTAVVESDKWKMVKLETLCTDIRNGINVEQINGYDWLCPDRGIVLPEYLGYCLKSEAFVGKAKSFAQCAVNQASIKVSDLKTIEIPLPPLSVQEEIVAEIESCQSVIDGARQVVNKYKPIIKIDPEWETKKLGEICEVQAGGTLPRDNGSFGNKDDYPWYTSGELNEIYTTEPVRHIPEEELNNSTVKIFPAGSLLIGMHDTAAFKMSILDRDAAFSQTVCGVKPCDRIDMFFLLLFLACNKDKYLKMRVGARQRNLTRQLISEIEIPIPSYAEQQKIVEAVKEEMAIVDQNKHLIIILQKKINDMIDRIWGE